MCNDVYWKITKFLIPLLLTSAIQDVGEQFLKRSLASSTKAVVELASFEIAFKIFSLFSGAADEFKYLSIVLLKTRKDRRNILTFALVFMLIPLLVMVLMGSIPEIVEKLYDVDGEVGRKSRIALLIFSFYPIIDAVIYVHFGVLIRYKYSMTCGVATISDVGAKIATVIIVLSVNNSLHVTYIPLVASYVGLTVRFVITFFVYYRNVHKKIIEESDELHDKGVSMKKILKTYFPLLVARTVQRISRPLLNLFVSRDRYGGNTKDQSLEALAILSVTYPVGHVFYGYINETKALEPTFTKENDSGESEATVKQVRLYIFGCFCASVFMNIIFFWIPGVTVPFVQAVTNVSEDIAKKCVVPLRILSFHCFPVVLRDTTVGWLLKIKRTSGIYPSVICRLCLIIVLGNVLPVAGFHGASMATAVLFSGFCIETLVILISATYIRWSRRRTIERERQDMRLVEDNDESNNELNDDKQHNEKDTLADEM